MDPQQKMMLKKTGVGLLAGLGVGALMFAVGGKQAALCGFLGTWMLITTIAMTLCTNPLMLYAAREQMQDVDAAAQATDMRLLVAAIRQYWIEWSTTGKGTRKTRAAITRLMSACDAYLNAWQSVTGAQEERNAAFIDYYSHISRRDRHARHENAWHRFRAAAGTHSQVWRDVTSASDELAVLTGMPGPDFVRLALGDSDYSWLNKRTSREHPEQLSKQVEEALRLRPNTGVPREFLHPNLIVCSGEDRRELMEAVRKVFPQRVPSHKYRCYEFWRFPNFSLVLSGIGSGCVEPLLWEVLDAENLGDKVAKRLVLIGTAGYLSSDTTGFGKVFLVEGAYPAGCAVQLQDQDLPLRPRFKGLERLDLPRAEEISTDHYYSCSPRDDQRIRLAQELDPWLRQSVAERWQQGRLISMESLQLYHFARCYGDEQTQYVALRGVANMADQFESQGTYSVQVLSNAFRHAVELMTQ